MLKLSKSEQAFLKSILAAPTDPTKKLVYADWLEENSDCRATFMRQFVTALESMKQEDFPGINDFTSLDPAWLDLIGYSAMLILAESAEALQYRDIALDALELAILIGTDDVEVIPKGSSKFGGYPDLPIGFDWPKAHQCDATLNEITWKDEGDAIFLAQLKLEEVQASDFLQLPLPSTGLISFFYYQDGNNCDDIGAKCFLSESGGELRTLEAPRALEERDEVFYPYKITLRETLRLPEIAWDEDKLPDVVSGWLANLGRRTLYGFRDEVDNCNFIAMHRGATTLYMDVSPTISWTSLNWVDYDGVGGFNPRNNEYS